MSLRSAAELFDVWFIVAAVALFLRALLVYNLILARQDLEETREQHARLFIPTLRGLLTSFMLAAEPDDEDLTFEALRNLANAIRFALDTCYIWGESAFTHFMWPDQLLI